MSTIHDTRLKKRSLHAAMPGIRSACLALFCLLSFLAAETSAQCDYKDNGYIFLHPFFDNVNWQASLYTSYIDVSASICSAKPVRMSVISSEAQGTAVYTTSGGSWRLTNGPLVNNKCLSCQPQIEFSDPVEITVPASVPLQATSPFHILCRSASASDSAYLIASSAKKVYCIHISTTSGAIGQIDTLSMPLSSDQAIAGVWGERNAVSLIDTAIWITGSNGLLLQIPFAGTSFGNVNSFSGGGSETFLCYGNGFAGTASGMIYSRNGTLFTLDTSVAQSPIRNISNLIAVGDAGTVVVRINGKWQSFSSGSSNYHYANLTANASGTAVELLDESWIYSSRSLFDTPTSIEEVTPPEAAAAIDSGVFHFSDNSADVITIKLGDPDNNRQLPVALIKKYVGKSSTVFIDSSTLLRQNPAAICTTAQSLYNDSVVKLHLQPHLVTVEAQAIKSVYYNPLWKWQSYTMKKTESWSSGDSLLLYAGNDTIRIVNSCSATVVSIKNKLNERNQSTIFHIYPNGNIQIMPCRNKQPSRVCIINPTGQTIWKKSVITSSSAALVSPKLPCGINFLRIEYADGTSEVHRCIITGK